MISNYSSAIRRFALSVAYLALIGAADVAIAQQSSAPPSQAATSASDSQSEQLQEIVVHAEQRTEKLVAVPISVQAISGQQLSENAIADTRDLATIAPTINFSTGYSALGSAFSLRGVSSLALQSGIQPSTAMVLDGVAVSRQAEFISNLSDIDHIEILNGPQGTLFGKNSTAGVINIVTKAPTSALEGYVEASATNDAEYGTKFMFNVPVTDKVRVRMTGFYDDQHPLIKNLTGPDVLGAESYGANLKAHFILTDAVDFLLSGTYSHTKSSAGQFVPVGASEFGLAYEKSFIGAGTICRCVPTINTNEAAIDLYKTASGSGTLNWSLSDELNLISITSYRWFSENEGIDETLAPYSIIVGQRTPTPGEAGILFQGVDPGFANRNPDVFHYVSQEVRINYIGGPLNVVGGGYYEDYHETYALDLSNILDGSLLGLTPGVPFFVNQGYPHSRMTDRTASLFGDATFAITKMFKAFGGVRFTNERVAEDYHKASYFGPASQFNQLTGVFAAPPVGTVNANSAHTINNVSGRAGLQFEPNDGMNFYVSYAHGYKAPAVQLGQYLTAGTDPIIKPETADAIEVGAKVRLLENRMAMNIALFNERIHAIQELVVEPVGPTFQNELLNAGTLRTRGVEADATFVVTPEFRLRAAVAYDDTAYSGANIGCTTYQTVSRTCPNNPTAGVQSINGQQAVESPKVKYSLNSRYTNTLPGSDLNYFVNVDWTWQSGVYYELGDDPISRQSPYGLLNASVGLQGRKWEIQLYGKNLTNKLFYSYMNDIGILGEPVGYLSRDFQRYGGVKLTYRY